MKNISKAIGLYETLARALIQNSNVAKGKDPTGFMRELKQETRGAIEAVPSKWQKNEDGEFDRGRIRVASASVPTVE